MLEMYENIQTKTERTKENIKVRKLGHDLNKKKKNRKTEHVQLSVSPNLNRLSNFLTSVKKIFPASREIRILRR